MAVSSKKGDFVLSNEAVNSLRNKGYTIKTKIGFGSYASVYLTYCEKRNADVAMKILDISRVGPEFINKFLSREIEAMTSIKKHKNIVKFYDYYKDEKYIYIVIEYCVNGDVYEYIRQHGKLSEKLACIWFKQLINGVSFIHKQGFAHRDLKCENLLLDSNFKLKITDFGFACKVLVRQGNSSASTQSLEALSKTFCGSILYASPELLQSQPYDPLKSDVWSCGVVLWIFLFGCYPFDEQTIKEAYERLDYSVQIPDSPEVSKECKDLINNILVEEKKRFTTSKIKKSEWFKKKWSKTDKMDRECFASVNFPRQETLEFNVGNVLKLSKSSDEELSPVSELKIPSKKKTEKYVFQKATNEKSVPNDPKLCRNEKSSK